MVFNIHKYDFIHKKCFDSFTLLHFHREANSIKIYILTKKNLN